MAALEDTLAIEASYGASSSKAASNSFTQLRNALRCQDVQQLRDRLGADKAAQAASAAWHGSVCPCSTSTGNQRAIWNEAESCNYDGTCGNLRSEVLGGLRDLKLAVDEVFVQCRDSESQIRDWPL